MSELSQSQRARLSRKHGSIRGWKFDIFENTHHYILNTISGELTETITRKGTTESCYRSSSTATDAGCSSSSSSCYWYAK